MHTDHGLLRYCIFNVHKALNLVLVNYLTCYAVIQLCSTLFNWINVSMFAFYIFFSI